MQNLNGFLKFVQLVGCGVCILKSITSPSLPLLPLHDPYKILSDFGALKTLVYTVCILYGVECYLFLKQLSFPLLAHFSNSVFG